MRLPATLEENTTVFQKNGDLYCETDYKKNFVPRCAFCSGFIMKVNNKLYCKTLCIRKWNTWNLFVFKNYWILCKITLKDCIKALDQTWHPDHFTCAKCGEAFGPSQVRTYFRENMLLLFCFNIKIITS